MDLFLQDGTGPALNINRIGTFQVRTFCEFTQHKRTKSKVAPYFNPSFCTPLYRTQMMRTVRFFSTHSFNVFIELQGCARRCANLKDTTMKEKYRSCPMPSQTYLEGKVNRQQSNNS